MNGTINDIFYHSLETFVLKMCESQIVNTHMHSALTGAQLFATRTPKHARLLAHVFRDLLILTTGKKIMKKSHI
jgi:hypothetical protein